MRSEEYINRDLKRRRGFADKAARAHEVFAEDLARITAKRDNAIADADAAATKESGEDSEAFSKAYFAENDRIVKEQNAIGGVEESNDTPARREKKQKQ